MNDLAFSTHLKRNMQSQNHNDTKRLTSTKSATGAKEARARILFDRYFRSLFMKAFLLACNFLLQIRSIQSISNIAHSRLDISLCIDLAIYSTDDEPSSFGPLRRGGCETFF